MVTFFEQTPSDKAHVEVVLRFYEAIFSGKWDVVEKCLSKNLIVEEAEAMPFRGTYHGFAGLKQLFEGLSNYWDNPTIKNNSITAGNGYVVGILTFIGRAKATGKTITMPILEIVEFENGLISSMKPFYWDSKAIAEALGAS